MDREFKISNAPCASFIAGRYLIANSGDRYLSWIGVLSIAGIAIGVAAMIVVLSVIDGFETELRNRFLAANAHVLAFQYPQGIEDISKLKKSIETDFATEITGTSPFVHSETMATKSTLMHSVLVRGVNPVLRKKVQDLGPVVFPRESLDLISERLTNTKDVTSSPDSTIVPPIIIGSGLASLLAAKVGDTIKLVRPTSESVGDLQSYLVVGLYDSGLKHYDNKIAILAINDAQELFRMKTRVHGLEIGLKDPDSSPQVAARMSDQYVYTIKEWQTFNKSMFDAMEMERSVIGLIVALVAFVASFNILTTLFISVTQKQRSISILKSLGATNGQILRVFVSQGLLIGVVGSFFGVLLAVVISYLLSRYEFIQLPDLYLLARLPIQYDPKVYASMALGGVVICLIAGIYPAWIASKVNIVDGFKGRAPATPRRA
jgi:lipoprotein-releasing system permease protein